MRARMTITIPVPLRSEMDAMTDINWSAVACAAFEEAIDKRRDREAKKNRRVVEDYDKGYRI